MKTPTLETERLILRPVRLEDAPELHRHFNNREVIKCIGGAIPWPYPENATREFLEEIFAHINQGTVFLWSITMKGNDNAIGLVEVRFRDDKDDNRGFWLAQPYWRQGYMTEAICAVNDFIFLKLGKTKIIVKSARFNKGSSCVKKKTGAKLIGTEMGNYLDGKAEEDIWEVTKESWLAAKEKL